MGQKTTVIVASLVILILTACNRYQVIPKQYQDQVNRNLTFVETKNDPQHYKGQTVVWGGEVLHATRLPDRTKIEVLQLPLTDDLIPAAERAESNGRFLAFDTQGEILDPAVVKEERGSPLSARYKEPSPRRPISVLVSIPRCRSRT